ncbi:MAG: Tetratricopeptide 2 repeat protein [Bryobacterales bacterium]|nr:Tetratricopeptide 2 repeat protein [Bryobacterales bacterium]
MGVKSAIFLALPLACTLIPAGLSAPDAYRDSGDNHFYNLEYDQAIADYTKLVQEKPDPIGYNDLASAKLYKILFQQGLLDSNAFGRDNRFLRNRRPQGDSSEKRQVIETLDRGRSAAEAQLAHDPREKLALYALCANYGLRATVEFTLEKAWFAALRSGFKARGYCDQVRKLDTNFTDAYLMLGVYEYATGSLPMAVKMFGALGGIHGNKKRGIEYVSHVAQEGKYERNAARVLLAVLYRREKRPLDAARVLDGLMAEYPRNYLFGIEIASDYADANQPERALGVLKNLLAKADQNPAGYRQMPREAVARKMQVLQAQLSGHRGAVS